MRLNGEGSSGTLYQCVVLLTNGLGTEQWPLVEGGRTAMRKIVIALLILLLAASVAAVETA